MAMLSNLQPSAGLVEHSPLLTEMCIRDRHDGVTYYFLDNEYYFKRTGLYGFYDDGERFAYFSRAILEMLFHIDFQPDLIHTNDWQTALVPVYLKDVYKRQA